MIYGLATWKGGKEREREKEEKGEVTNLSTLISVHLLIDKAQVVVQQWVLGASAEYNGVVFDCLLPPALDATQVTHIGVGIDVVLLDGQSLTVATLRFFWPVCKVHMVCKCSGSQEESTVVIDAPFFKGGQLKKKKKRNFAPPPPALKEHAPGRKLGPATIVIYI